MQEKNIRRIYENGESKLVPHLADEAYSILQACKNPTIPEGFCAQIKCDKGNFLITGLYTSRQKISGNTLIIDSVTNQDGNGVSTELCKMKNMLGIGLSEISGIYISTIEVEISKNPFKAHKVKSHTAENGKNGNPKPQQTVANSDAKSDSKQKTPVPKKTAVRVYKS